MSYISEQQKQLMLDRLEENSDLTYEELSDILYGYQIASANASATGRIKGIIIFLDKGNFLTFLSNQETKIIHNKYEFAELIKSIDSSVDISTSRLFRDHF